jgi:Tfp pilus assembly protein PilN
MTTFTTSTCATVNLLPVRRRTHAQRMQLVRRWVAGLGIWCLSLGIASAVILVGSRSSNATFSAFETSTNALEASKAQLASIDTQRSLYRKKVAAARAVGHHPDWSILLSMLARDRGSTISFENIEITHTLQAPAPTSTRQPAKPVRQDDRFSLSLAGFADSVASINAFAVRLEESGLFESVSRLDAGGTTERGAAFRIVCELKDASEPRSKP